MQMKTRALIESLESRQLLSATLPSAVGNFIGTVVYSGGTATLDLDILTQKGGSLKGVGAISVTSTSGRISGSINKKNVVHLTGQGNGISGTVVGTLTGDTLTGILKFHRGKTKITAEVSLSRSNV
jgi:hypothetical protein